MFRRIQVGAGGQAGGGLAEGSDTLGHRHTLLGTGSPGGSSIQARTCSEVSVGGRDVFEIDLGLLPQVGRLQVGVVLLAQPPPGLLDLRGEQAGE